MLNSNRKNKGFTPTPTLAWRLSAGFKSMPKLVSGFTFLETIVAVGILTIALASPLMLASSSIRAAGAAKDKFIASFLASEAIEYIKNVRDNNALEGKSGDEWLDPLLSHGQNSCLPAEGGCVVDVTKTGVGAAVASCGSSCPPIKYDTADGLYQYQSGVDTKFTRIAEIEELTPNQEAKIIVTVSWDGGNSLVIQDNIFNWR